MSTELLLALMATFTGVAVVVGTITMKYLERQTPEYQRIRKAISGAGANASLASSSAKLSVEASSPEQWQRFERALRLRSPKEMARLRRRLSVAGYRWAGAATAMALTEVLAPLVIGGVALLLLGFTPAGWIAAGLGAVLGFMAPGLWLDWRVEIRKDRIRDGLPDTLDLLVVCLEAGSSVDQAIVKTTAELSVAYPEVADEFRMITSEIRAGKPRNEAFRSFAERTRLDEARALATMLVQTERFGTSVAQALRAHADSVRVQRRQRAEERAAKVAVKLVFPLVIFLFPALYVVLLGPAVLDIIRTFE